MDEVMTPVAQCPAHVREFDHFDLNDPFASYKAIREDAPIYFDERLNYWIVSRYADVKAIFDDWETFSSENARQPMRPICAAARDILAQGGFTAYSGLSARVPPEHTRVRKVFSAAFTPKRYRATTNFMANGLRELLRNRAVWNALLADRAKIPAAMEEVLRISPSVITWRRRVLKTVTLHGIELPAGSNVLLLLGAANRDADVFENGEAFDLDRPNARNHLSLGFGIHYCIGALLAKMQLQIVLEELLERYLHLQLVPDQTFDYPRNASFRGPRAVLVEGLRSPAPAFGART